MEQNERLEWPLVDNRSDKVYQTKDRQELTSDLSIEESMDLIINELKEFASMISAQGFEAESKIFLDEAEKLVGEPSNTN